jgi:hypothetical protein
MEVNICTLTIYWFHFRLNTTKNLFDKYMPEEPLFTELLINHIQHNTPIIFAKFGDGEFSCMTQHRGSNCDNDAYTPALGNGLVNSIQYFASLPNAYIGQWHTGHVASYLQSLTPNPIKFVDYHSIIFDKKNHDLKAELIRTINKSSTKKIMIANELMVKAKSLLKLDDLVVVPMRRWFDSSFDTILENCNRAIGDCDRPLILTAAGMGAKVLIAKLHMLYPNGLFLDIGSAYDKILTKRATREPETTYEELIELIRDILPEDWEDSKYNYIYDTAKYELGIHMPR